MSEQRAELKDRLRDALNLREKKAVDLVKDLGIPKSAVSQYLSGKSQKMDSDRLYSICQYLKSSDAGTKDFGMPSLPPCPLHLSGFGSSF